MNYTRMIIFSGILLLILTALDYFVISRWKKYCKSKNYNKNWYRIPFWISIIMLLIFVFSNYYNFMVFPGPEYINWLNLLTSFWYLPKLVIVPVLIVIELIRFSTKLFKPKSAEQNIPEIKPSVYARRKFIGNLAWSFAGVPFALAVKGLAHTVYDLKLFRETIYLPNLPLNLDGIKIVQLSDLHFGKYMKGNILEKIGKIVNSLSPDLILITGDFVNFRYEELDFGDKFLRSLKSYHGVYACLGNHDHYMSNEDHQKLLKRINNTGVKLLINENRTLKIKGSELNLIGVDNIGSRQTFGDFDKAYEGINPKNVSILMSHDPKTWESHVLGKRFTDLTLSGHTHGGQVAFEFLGFDLSPVKAVYKHFMGLYSQGNQYLYVNRGIGVSGPPIRLGVNPEITLFTLKKPLNLVSNS
ncbi:MAG: metallophosphoesterase [Candidatus Kapabacteria bacterium]|nr:metallophosphoesterase [Ignavibacteriota bacterium]MCW5886158.1 metallophosphoesterase [Candidatus Kapabacteria bacterium]